MTKRTLVIIFFLSVFILGFLPVKDTDFGWHYRCGKEIFTIGTLCTQNRFSYFLPEYKAYNPSFLYDFALASTYDNFGFVGVSFLGGIIFVLISYFFLKLAGNIQFWLKMIAFYTFFFLSRSTLELGLRSQIVTLLFFCITLLLIKTFPRQAFFLPLLMLFWVNTHIGFFVGLIALLFWLLEEVSIYLKARNQKSGQTIIRVGIILLLSFLATLINPFGFKVYLEIVNHFFAPMNEMIAEWVAPPLWQKAAVIVIGIIVFISILEDHYFSFFKLLLLLFFTLLALLARRNLPFFYLICLSILLPRYIKKLERVLPQTIHPAFLLALLTIFISLPRLIATSKFDTSWSAYCNDGLTKYPCQAIEKNPKLSGNIYAAYEWGGFLIWQLPRAKVFVDGRMPAWKDKEGNSPYQVYLYIIQARDGWNEKLVSLKTDYLLIQPGTFLDLLLQEKAAKFGWQEQYRDKTSALYRRQTDRR